MHAASSADLWVVVPTYWGSARTSPFDHPTPLDGQSTLPRLLNSLLRQEKAPPFQVLVLLASESGPTQERALHRLREVLAPYHKGLTLWLAGPNSLHAVSRSLRRAGLDSAGIDTTSYAGVRNLQLLIPAALGAQAVAAVDDDEVLPPDYLWRAWKTLKELGIEENIFGVAGPYLDTEGSPFLPEKPEPPHRFAAKSAYMNATLRGLIQSEEPYPTTPLALGGNMLFPRSLFTRVGFDPGITRGEDIDYLLNSMLAGHPFYFDRRLTITHIPPRQYSSPPYVRLRHDVFRFIYQREKIRTAGLPRERLDPYPGQMLLDGLEEEGLAALQQAHDAGLEARWGNPRSILDAAKQHAARFVPAYFSDFATRWPEMVAALEEPTAADAIRQALAADGGTRGQ